MGGNIKLVVVIDNTTCKVITNTNNSSSSTNKILTINNVARWGHLGGTIYIKYWLKNLVKWQHFLCICHSDDCRENRHWHTKDRCLLSVHSLFWAFSPAWTPSFLPFYSLIGQSLLWLFTRFILIGLDLFVHSKIYQSCQNL